MKTVKFEWNGRTYYLCLNGAALCDIYEHFGAEKSVFELLEGSGRKSFDAACWLFYKLSEQGELVRRYLGYENGEIPTPETIEALLTPRDVPRMKRTIKTALELGFEREVKDDRPVDLGLLELEKKEETT